MKQGKGNENIEFHNVFKVVIINIKQAVINIGCYIQASWQPQSKRSIVDTQKIKGKESKYHTKKVIKSQRRKQEKKKETEKLQNSQKIKNKMAVSANLSIFTSKKKDKILQSKDTEWLNG